MIDNSTIDEGFLPVDTVDKKKEHLANLDVILKCKEIHWSRKAECKWLKEGDGNTQFFHKLANGKKGKNSIARLVIEGETVEDLDNIKEEAIRFYSIIFYKEEGN